MKKTDPTLCLRTAVGVFKHKKGKVVPLQTWIGPEGSRKLRFPNFMTTAQGGGKVVSLMHRPHLPPGNSPGAHFCQRLSVFKHSNEQNNKKAT